MQPQPESSLNFVLVPRYTVECSEFAMDRETSSSLPLQEPFSTLRAKLINCSHGTDGSVSCPLTDPEIDMLAAATYARLRSLPADFPCERDSDLLNRIPVIDRLRSLTKEDDLSWIVPAISEQHIELSGLLLSLLQPFDRISEVHSFLLNTWETALPALRAHLLWRILDMPGLSDAVKNSVLDFILDEWEAFNFASAKFLATDIPVIDQIRKRVNDAHFPAEKKWVYLCRVVEPEPDKEAVRSLLRENLTSNDEFTIHVADALLRRFFPS